MDNTSRLSKTEAHSRLQRYGLNQLPKADDSVFFQNKLTTLNFYHTDLNFI
jgi:hypothetical protein